MDTLKVLQQMKKIPRSRALAEETILSVKRGMRVIEQFI